MIQYSTVRYSDIVQYITSKVGEHIVNFSSINFLLHLCCALKGPVVTACSPYCPDPKVLDGIAFCDPRLFCHGPSAPKVRHCAACRPACTSGSCPAPSLTASVLLPVLFSSFSARSPQERQCSPCRPARARGSCMDGPPDCFCVLALSCFTADLPRSAHVLFVMCAILRALEAAVGHVS